MIKQTTLLFLLLASFTSLSAQHISVESFRMLENDMDARVHHPKLDQNGEVAALIKVVTTETGFTFDGGSLGIVASEQKVAEIWVYVPRGAQRITIMHPQLGVLRNHAYPISIEAATVYEMRLVTGRVETTVIPPHIESQWLVITSEPEGADVYINNEPVGITPYYNELPVGDYTWRLSASLYQPEAGAISLEAGDDKRIEIHEVLKPDYGTLIVRSSPESGAAITINGFETGQTTPATIPRIISGEVLVTLRLNEFETTSKQIELEAGAELTVDIPMRPTFAVVTIETEPTSDIFINEQRRGNGRWEGRLGTGIYNFEARLDKHRPAIERRQVNALENFTLNLNPQPITGNLRVMSSPHGAGIRIAGTDHGTTPTTIRNLLIGNYDVELILSGYTNFSERVTIREDETVEIYVTLSVELDFSMKYDLILNFIEKYRIAFENKKTDMIYQFFDANAIIIVGRQNLNSKGENVQYLSLSLEEYFKHLIRSFDTNNVIKIDFENVNIAESNIYDSIYEVRINQYYTSDTYSDVGHLLLAVDFRGYPSLKFVLRAWHPGVEVNDLFRVDSLMPRHDY